jgi:hypothetical protein
VGSLTYVAQVLDSGDLLHYNTFACSINNVRFA